MIAALAAALLFAAGSPPPAPTLTRAPQLERFVEADYPPDELAAKREGAVTLDVDIDAQGLVTRVAVVESSGHVDFDHAAIEAVSQFVFTPAEFDGKPAPVRLTYKYAFTLKPEAPPPAPKELPVTFEGRLLERGTRRPLPAAAITIVSGPTAETDAQGRFAFRGLPPGRYQVKAAAPDHVRFETTEEVRAGEVTQATYFLRKKSYSGYEATVRGEREKKEVARKSLSLEEIKRVPGTSGDAVAVVETLPGTSRIPYGLGILVVRGTRQEDTRSYLDGIWIPLIFHFGGFPVSVVNADALGGIDFFAGNFSARYGNAIGGAVEARTRAPNADGYHGYADLSAIDSKAMVEGPTTANGSFLAAARVSYVDTVLRIAGYGGISPRYADYIARHDWKLGDAHAALYAYGSSDTLTAQLPSFTANAEEQEGTTTSIMFHRLQGLYEAPLGPRLTERAVSALGWDRREVSFGKDISGGGDIFTWQARDDLVYRASSHLELTLGTEIGFGRYRYRVTAPDLVEFTQIPDPLLSRELQSTTDYGGFFSPSLYAFAAWSPAFLPGLRVVPGVRAGWEYFTRDGRVDPRLAAFYEVAPWLTLKGAAGLYSSPPDFNQGQLLNGFGNPDLKWEDSTQSMVGASGRLGPLTTWDVQLYYKDMRHLVVPSDRIVTRNGQPARENWANGGAGWSEGLEVLLRQELGAGFFGWISYTLSKSRWEMLNGLGWTNFPFDQRHNVIAVLSYALPRDYTVGTSVRYTTGNWDTPIVRSLYDSDCDCYLPIAGRIASVRNPDYFEVDLRVDKTFVFDRWRLNAYVDVRNLFDRQNVEAANYNYDFTRKIPLYGIPIFPNLGVRGEF